MGNAPTFKPFSPVMGAATTTVSDPIDGQLGEVRVAEVRAAEVRAAPLAARSSPYINFA